MIRLAWWWCLEALQISAFRWSRTFSDRATFSDDLGNLGVFVGPRRGPLRRTQEQKEDYVLRRVLVAQNRAGLLRFPFKVHASQQAPRAPDFLIEDEGGSRGLEVTEAGDQRHQRWMTETEADPGNETVRLIPGDGWTPPHISRQIREAVERKVQKFDEGAYQGSPCDLAVYNNTEDVVETKSPLPGVGVIDDVRGSCTGGRFEHVHLVDGDQVYMDMLGVDRPRVVNLRDDYNIDVCSWIAAQVDMLRSGDFSRLDVENLIEELIALARRDRRALESRLENHLSHLLKWHRQPSGRSGSWHGTIRDNCRRIDRLVADSPGLRKLLDPDGEAIAEAYSEARAQAAIETGIAEAEFPNAFPWPNEFSDVAQGVRSLQTIFGGPPREG
ncbi:MAG: DUF29 domain-containing protein [Gammaproteobacteria bacterium]|nr:DUF29 domain-containing protein [Gammaproteobacteria bacterium]